MIESDKRHLRTPDDVIEWLGADIFPNPDNPNGSKVVATKRDPKCRFMCVTTYDSKNMRLTAVDIYRAKIVHLRSILLDTALCEFLPTTKSCRHIWTSCSHFQQVMRFEIHGLAPSMTKPYCLIRSRPASWQTWAGAAVDSRCATTSKDAISRMISKLYKRNGASDQL